MRAPIADIFVAIFAAINWTDLAPIVKKIRSTIAREVMLRQWLTEIVNDFEPVVRPLI